MTPNPSKTSSKDGSNPSGAVDESKVDSEPDEAAEPVVVDNEAVAVLAALSRLNATIEATDPDVSPELAAAIAALSKLGVDDVAKLNNLAATGLLSSQLPVESIDVDNRDGLGADDAAHKARAAASTRHRHCHGGVHGAASIKLGHPGRNGMDYRAMARPASALGRTGVELHKTARGTPVRCSLSLGSIS